MQFIYLTIGTILALMFIIFSFAGSKYQQMFDGLEGDEFPLKGMYCVGYVWSTTPILALKGKTREKLITQARLVFDAKYAEYYATVVWVQTISFVHLCLTFGFLLAGLTDSILFLIIGLVFTVVLGSFFTKNITDKLSAREIECKAELPEIISTLALLVNAGMMLRDAWKTIAYTKDGMAYDFMKQSCQDMENGMSEVDAIHKFGKYTNSADVRKFTSALAQSMERGGGELTDFLTRQTTEMWALKKQTMLQKGEAAASKLLLPTVLLFVGIIIAVISGALGMLI